MLRDRLFEAGDRFGKPRQVRVRQAAHVPRHRGIRHVGQDLQHRFRLFRVEQEIRERAFQAAIGRCQREARPEQADNCRWREGRVKPSELGAGMLCVRLHRRGAEQDRRRFGNVAHRGNRQAKQQHGAGVIGVALHRRPRRGRRAKVDALAQQAESSDKRVG